MFFPSPKNKNKIIMKKSYITPTVKVKDFVLNKLMIPISGETTPEEADAKGGGWDSDEQSYRHYNVWDE